jgi:hypothetical protein
MTEPFAPVNGAGAPRTANAKPNWVSVVPVPADAPPPPAEHFKLGKPIATWTYTDPTRAVLGYVLRFDSKQFRPLTLRRPAGGAVARRLVSVRATACPPSPRPSASIAAQRPGPSSGSLMANITMAKARSVSATMTPNDSR